MEETPKCNHDGNIGCYMCYQMFRPPGWGFVLNDIEDIKAKRKYMGAWKFVVNRIGVVRYLTARNFCEYR
jgi:hypothetical protein